MTIRIVKEKHGLKDKFEKTVREAEARYEMSSDEMARALADGTERETEDKLRWMFAFRAHRSLTEAQIHTTGTHGITIDLSTKTGLRTTGS